MYPKVVIKIDKIIRNYKVIKSLCDKNGIEPSIVTKLLSGNKEIVSSLIANGVKCISDSKITNLADYSDLNVEKWLIRLPSLSEVHEVVKYADVSLNSELSTIQALNEEAFNQRKVHKVILMYELGDLREGCMEDDLKKIIGECIKLKNIKIYGLGVNLSCYGEIVPTDENMKELVSVADEIENEYNIKFQVISGGNSSSYEMMSNGRLPSRINNLRIGESLFLGRIPCFEKEINELNHNNFILKTQIIELKEKPSKPWGKQGNTNSFGEHLEFKDKGIRKRAIIGIGRQDVKIDSLMPVDKDIEIVGGSSDHIILDVTDCRKDYKVGDVIDFNLDYSGVLSVMTSKYVQKEIEKK